MTFSLTWLADVLRANGLTVIEERGWQSHGHGDMGKVLGVLCHHTAGPLGGGCDPSLGVVEHGRPDLAGPLAQLLLDRAGTYHVVAGGLAWHAGAGSWQGITSGNTHFIGIEAENAGIAADAWPAVQMLAYVRGVAAILNHVGAHAGMCAGHKEYALPKGRKSDPDFDMSLFRNAVAEAMVALAAPPASPAPGAAPVAIAPKPPAAAAASPAQAAPPAETSVAETSVDQAFDAAAGGPKAG